ncbi:hypothetical protein HMN09_00972800 [Mycena chlorophos]|uniref:Mid2 domain-containing protein n=1 Tax=Mycena chlorophos TaxID=658473 RepID=A0A8H6W2V2_MYCCL|nr:hypothetical protein HMN09_00972800 [Mycena chlorophos]
MFKPASFLPAVILGVVAFAQVVEGSFKFNFSPVVQCGEVTIAFSGSDSNNHTVPTYLTIIPLASNSTPIQIPIPPGSTNSTGIGLSFIPLPENTEFVATLDDASGPASRVSDVTLVLPATATNGGSSTCLASSTTATTKLFEVPTVLSQCEDFTVRFSTPDAPIITAYQPNGNAETVLPTPAGAGTATYTIAGNRGNQVALMLNATNQLEATSLFTISGDSSSPTTCLNSTGNGNGQGHNFGNNNNHGSNGSSKGLPKGAIIGIAVGGSVLVLASLVLLFFLLRERKRRKRASGMRFDPAMLSRDQWPSLDEKKIVLSHSASPTLIRFPPPNINPEDGFDADSGRGSAAYTLRGIVRDPLYTNDKWRQSMMTDDGTGSVRTSISSWSQPVPEDQQISPPPMAASAGDRDSTMSMTTMDIHDVLQMATVHRDASTSYTRAQRGQPPATAATNNSFDVTSKPSMARLRTSNPPDLPQGVSPITRSDSVSTALMGGMVARTAQSESYLNVAESFNYGYAVSSDEAQQHPGAMASLAPSGVQSSNNSRKSWESFGNMNLP